MPVAAKLCATLEIAGGAWAARVVVMVVSVGRPEVSLLQAKSHPPVIPRVVVLVAFA